MTTGERLENWRANGVITEAQHATLAEIVRRDRFSVFVELNALLYIGVVSIVGGLAWTFRDYVVNLGDAAILSMLGLLMAGAFGYCFTQGARIHQRRDRVVVFRLRLRPVFRVPGTVGDAGVHRNAVRRVSGLGYALLIAALVFGALAYRFDNRFVLSLALSTLAGYLGLKISNFDTLDTDRLRFAGFLYGAFLIGIGVLLYQRRIKAHFLEVYLQLGANALLMAAISGVLERDNGWAYLVVLLAFAAAAIYLGVRYRRFAFVTYGTLYGYAGVSVRLLAAMGGLILGLTYFIVTGSIVVILLVVLARRFGRDE